MRVLQDLIERRVPAGKGPACEMPEAGGRVYETSSNQHVLDLVVPFEPSSESGTGRDEMGWLAVVRRPQQTWWLRAGSFGITLLVWGWIAQTESPPWLSAAIIVGAIALIFPCTWLARTLADRAPMPDSTASVTFYLHWALMILLGAGIVEAVQTAARWRGWELPISPGLGLALMWITGIADLLTVANLALRGLGAPFAIHLSERLATDWLYRYTRNPMVLATLAFLVSFGLWVRSAAFVVWVLALVTPAFLYYLLRYEERELEIRFGEPYRVYKARTPMLLPRRPAAHQAAPAPARKPRRSVPSKRASTRTTRKRKAR